MKHRGITGPVEQYLKSFSWNKIKYRVDKPLWEIMDLLQKVRRLHTVPDLRHVVQGLTRHLANRKPLVSTQMSGGKFHNISRPNHLCRVYSENRRSYFIHHALLVSPSRRLIS